MGIMDLFRTAPSGPAPNPGVDPKLANPNLQPTPAPVDLSGDPMKNKPPGTEPGSDPSIDASAKNKGSLDANPLAEFDKLWQTDPNAQTKTRPALSADPAKIAEAAKKIDFTRGVDPAVAQKALGGDVAAFMSVLQAVGQNSFAIGTQASTHLVDRHVSAVSDFERSTLPDTIRLTTAKDGLLGEHPMLSNPAVKPVIDVLQAQFAQQYPQATAAELQAHTIKYLSGVVETMVPGATAFGKERRERASQPAKVDPNVFDWEQHLTRET